jgi:hypothetical protein
MTRYRHIKPQLETDDVKRDQWRVAFSAFCPTMIRSTSGLSD